MSLLRCSAFTTFTAPSVFPYCRKYQFGNENGPIVITPLSSTVVVLVNDPSSNPAIAVTILKVDPGGYAPPMLRLNIGKSGFFVRASYSPWDMPTENPSGENPGLEYIANTSPLEGLVTITAPFSPTGNASAAALDNPASKDSVISSPASSSCRPSVRKILPLESISTSSLPSLPL